MLSDSIKGIAATTASFINGEDMLLVKLYSDKIKDRYLSTSSATFSHIYEKMEERKDRGSEDRLNEAIGINVKYKDLLNKIRHMNNLEAPISIYIAENSGLRMVLTTDEAFLAGAIYDIKPEIARALNTGQPQATGIYRDKDGIWISAYAPLPAVYSDENRMLVEINYSIGSYINRLHREMRIILLVCLLGFLGAAFVSNKLITSLVSKIEKLNEAAKGLEEENYSAPIDVKSDDEIGHLADTFEKLRLSIRNKIDELKLSIVREKRAHLESVVALTNAIEMRDPYTKEHLSRVVRYALLIAKGMQLDKEDMIKLRYACFLHDIGKLYTGEALLKKEKLSQEEFEEIKKHPQQGAKIIEGINFLKGVKEAVLYHQERYDGKGYPAGLKGDNIPLLARIIAVADAFDAMTTDRPYKKRMDFMKAMDEIKNNSGTQFDPKLCEIFLKYRNSIEEIARKHFEHPAD
jgi:putative nucleotidyltransferase with HDIG domain